MGGGTDKETRLQGARRPGRLPKSGAPCHPCEGDDTRLGPGHSRQDYVHSRMRSRGRAPGAQHGHALPHPGHQHHQRHFWIWMPKAKRWAHLEPAGTREISPGRIVRAIGKLVPTGALPRGWPKMQITPPNFLVHHGAPGLVPMGERGLHLVHAPSAHVPGHYGWSPVLHKHVWIGAHTKGPAVAPSQLAPAAREAFAHMARQSKANATQYAHAHTFWGASGARTSIIPGHWQWNQQKHDWCYIEPHTDTSGRPATTTYAIAQAPPAAFGPRPSYLPALHFWPDTNGRMVDAHGRSVMGAAQTITMPPHARYAYQQGLLDPGLAKAVLGSGSAFQNALAAGRSQRRELMGGGFMNTGAGT